MISKYKMNYELVPVEIRDFCLTFNNDIIHIESKKFNRYYSEVQLTVANRIKALRSMGLGLIATKELLLDVKCNVSIVILQSRNMSRTSEFNIIHLNYFNFLKTGR